MVDVSSCFPQTGAVLWGLCVMLCIYIVENLKATVWRGEMLSNIFIHIEFLMSESAENKS